MVVFGNLSLSLLFMGVTDLNVVYFGAERNDFFLVKRLPFIVLCRLCYDVETCMPRVTCPYKWRR